MRRGLALVALVALLLLPVAARAATPNEIGFLDHLAKGGTWVGQTWVPVYDVCWWGSGSLAKPCNTKLPQINVTHKDRTGYSLPELTAEWQGVYTLPGFAPATGSDNGAVIIDHIRDRYNEFWVMTQDPAIGWRAWWGGGEPFTRMIKKDGLWIWPTPNTANIFGPGTPTAHFPEGMPASGIAFVPGLIRLGDMRAGAINHPIQVTVPNACQSKPPATRGRSDTRCWAPSVTVPAPVQYGAKFKLDPSINVDARLTGKHWCFPSVNRTGAQATALGWTGTNCPLPPMAKMILKAVQGAQYIVVTDQSGGQTGINFNTESINRPRSGNWTGVTGNPFAKYLGCDGVQNTGQYNAHVLAPGEWEQDCAAAQWSAWSGFPRTGWYEIP
jgi:hypothetical protein